MKIILSERNIVVVLFVMVLITFSLAQEDSKKMEKGFANIATSTSHHLYDRSQTTIETPEKTDRTENSVTYYPLLS